MIVPLALRMGVSVMGQDSGRGHHITTPREGVIKKRQFLTVTMGALVFSGLLVAGCGSADAPAGAEGASTDLPDVTQNRDKALPAAQRAFLGLVKRADATEATIPRAAPAA